MKNLVSRSLSGLIYAGLIFFGTTGHPWLFLGLMAVFMIMCLIEYISITELSDKLYIGLLFLGAAAIFYYFTDYLLNQHSVFIAQPLSFAGPILFILAIYTLFFSSNELYIEFGKATVGLIYIALPFSLALTLPVSEYQIGKEVITPEIFYIFILLWASDSFAYIIGSLWGKHKFAPKISSGKSWEGAIGGFIFTLVTAGLFHFYFFPESRFNWLIVGAIIAFFAPIGDLAESKLKRLFNAKDSGKLIPGHGGFLDRLDSFIFVIPMVYLYLLLINVL
ncbi:MAG: phosphatidate cytidylyltransferase [Weeksellaceae bacterium]|jgi:phosphatidate cytidylyltransferase|nr:phosphatidate cytidylyltransferase [Weeksellaceae bacterium]MDX9704672.1 phosphatidate cytidylyltransferase [Weeksellaceae bacterium]